MRSAAAVCLSFGLAVLLPAQTPLPDTERKKTEEKLVSGFVAKMLDPIFAPDSPILEDPRKSELADNQAMVEVQPFVLKMGRHKLEVTPATATVVERHAAVPLSKVENGATLYVLGRFQKKQPIPDSDRKMPAQIIGIVTVVLARSFEPPPLNKAARELRLEWFKGELTRRGDRLFRLGDTSMQIGPDRNIVRLTQARLDDLTKKEYVAVSGRIAKEGKRRTIVAPSRIVRVDRRIPLAEQVHVLGE